MKLKPIGKFVHIKYIKSDDYTTSSGLVLQANRKSELFDHGRVIEIGNEVPSDVLQTGDNVVYRRMRAIELDGNDRLVEFDYIFFKLANESTRIILKK